MDIYLDDEQVYERLKQDFFNHDKLIVAYDFDNTVYSKDGSCDMVIDLLKRCRPYAKLILFTARDMADDDVFDEVMDYISENDIPCDYINENIIPIDFKTGRKIYYNIFLDDRAGLSSAYYALKKLIDEIEGGEI